MSKVKIQGNASGSGVFTLTTPNTSTDRTITLPDASGTLAFTTDDDDKLPLAGGTLTGNLVVGGTITQNKSGDSMYLNRTSDDGNILRLQREGSTKAALGVTSNNLTLEVGGTTRMTITSAGLIGIGVTDPDSKLEVNGNMHLSGNLRGKQDSTTEIGGAFNVGGIKRIHMVQGGELRFGDTTNTNPLGITEGAWNNFGDQDYLSIHFRSKLELYASNGSKRLRIDGDGIKFGSDTAAANALDDYEEGNWTPSWSPSGGSWSGTGVGKYTKIGRQVTASFNWIGSGQATGSKFNSVGGLPFTSLNETTRYPAIVTMNGAGASGNTLNATVSANSASINLQMQPQSTGAHGEFTPAQTGSGAEISATVTYFVA